MRQNITITLSLLWGTFSLLSGCSSNKIPEATEAPIPQSVIAAVLADDNTTNRDCRGVGCCFTHQVIPL